MHEIKRPASRLMAIAFSLNLLFSLIEMVGGAALQSQAVVANGLHDFSDALFVGLSWFFEKKSEQVCDQIYTYGYRRFSLVASFLTGILLIVGSLLILVSSAEHLLHGEGRVPSADIFWFVALGIFVNGASYFVTHRKHDHAHHEKMLSLHFLEDLAGWIFILVGALVSRATGYSQIDLWLSMILAVWIIFRGTKQLRKVARVLMQISPGKHELILDKLKTFTEIKTVHHLHLWTMEGEHHILTSHLVLNEALLPQEMSKLKINLRTTLRKEFSITDSTFEIEVPGEVCLDVDCH